MATWVTLMTDTRGRPPSPLRSRTLPGRSAYLRREVIATTLRAWRAYGATRRCSTTGNPSGSVTTTAAGVVMPWKRTVERRLL